MSDAAQTKDLTSASSVQWEAGIPMVDVVAILSNNSTSQSKPFWKLRNCAERLKGRAYGRFSNVKLSLLDNPAYASTVVVGWVPSTSGAASAPSTGAEVLACGGVILRSSPYYLANSASPIMIPGISNVLKSDDVTLLIGSPPTFYFGAKSIKLSDNSVPKFTPADANNAASGYEIYVQISYTLELSGVSFLKPF
jgi:hypothetical protein